MMRITLFFLLLVPFFTLAQSPEKLIKNGEYDRAIEVCVGKLQDGKGKKHELYSNLKQAFDFATEQDQAKIAELKASGKPEIWFDVFMVYSGMQKRFVSISNIHTQLVEDQVRIELTDYTKDVEASRQNAAAYLYAHSVSLLKTGQKADAGQAYSELLLITRLYDDYKDVETLLPRAIGSSATLARLEINNRSDAYLSPDFIVSMENMALTFNERQYLNYVVKADPGQHYSLVLSIDISKVDVSPGTVNEKEYTTSHKDPESFASSYEDKAKFEKDKKHPDFNKCNIKEIYQIKTATIKGKVKYVDKPSGKVLYEVPVTAHALFENKTATASGDMFACPPEIQEILDKPKMKFPKNAEMVKLAGQEFKKLVKGVIWNPAFIN